MIEVIGGNLFQWDTGRVIRINTDTNIHEVHFTTKDMTYAYVVSTYEKDGAVYCEIPNIILQQEKSLICYEITNTDGGEMTVAEKTLALHKRNKPQDYVYTEDELKNFDRLSALIPTRLSQLTDDIGAGGAKITSVNGISPDENGNVEVQAGIDSADVARIVKDEFAGGVGYVASKEIVTLYPETQLDFIEQDGLYVHQTTTSDFMLPVVGETYTVKWDGTEYECACSAIHIYPTLGNLSIGGSTGGEEYPFIIMEQNGTTIIGTTTSETSHTISILRTETTYSLINSNYLPVATNDSVGLIKDKKYIFDLTKEQTQETIKEWLIIADDETNDLYYKLDENTILKAYKVTGFYTTHFSIYTDKQHYIKYEPNADGLYDWTNGEGIYLDLYAPTLTLRGMYGFEKKLGVGAIRSFSLNTNNLEDSWVGVTVDSLIARNFVEAEGFNFRTAGNMYYYLLSSDSKGNLTLVKYPRNGYAAVSSVQIPTSENMVLKSSTEGSTKQFKITVDDSGTITATEVSN